MMRAIFRIKVSLIRFIEYVIREKRLPTQLTENRVFRFPEFLLYRWKNYRKQSNSAAVAVYLPHLQPRYIYQVLHLSGLTYTDVIFYWEFSLKNYIRLGNEGRRLFAIKNLKIKKPPVASFQAPVVIAPGRDYVTMAEKNIQATTIIGVQGNVSEEAKENSFLLPYCIHPFFLENFDYFNTHLNRLRTNQRSVSIFFSGAVGVVQDKDLVERLYDVPSRDKCVQFLSSHAENLNIYVIDNFTERKIFNSKPDSYSGYSVLLCNCKGTPEKWLEELSSANFFLALPGSHMLMCHNAIECMAVGTIPIISYENWFFPNLINGKNCLTYRTLDDLKSVIKYANSLDAVTLKNMRQAVSDYYDQYLNILKVSHFLKNFRGMQLQLYINHEDADTLKNATPNSVLSTGGKLQKDYV